MFRLYFFNDIHKLFIVINCAEEKDDLVQTIQRYYEEKNNTRNRHQQYSLSSSSWDREWVIL